MQRWLVDRFTVVGITFQHWINPPLRPRSVIYPPNGPRAYKINIDGTKLPASSLVQNC